MTGRVRRALRIVDQHPASLTVLGRVEEAGRTCGHRNRRRRTEATLMDLLHRELGAYLISG